VGKEVAAQHLHRHSARASGPFVALNCAALSESLLESELFGHEKGAFTGATHTKPGLLESAEGGTVLLDEIGELPMSLQVKLLRVLEERRVRRVGGLTDRPIDVRFVAATHRNLEAEVARGKFRQDLYFRLNGITLNIPPLRERVEEIVPLAEMFLAQVCAQEGRRRSLTLSPEARKLLLRHRWPGNVRELKNVMERAALLVRGDVITLEDLPAERMEASVASASSEGWVEDIAPAPVSYPQERRFQPDQPHATPSPPSSRSFGPVSASVVPPPPPSWGPGGSEAERQAILEALEQCAGNQTKAASLLGISRGKLVARLSLYGVPRPRGTARRSGEEPED